MPIPDLIAAVNERLTPAERRIAEAVLADPTLLAFGTVSALASHVGTSRPTIVRFASKLGFEGFGELQNAVRASLSQRLSRPSQRIRHANSSVEASIAALEGALRPVLEMLGGGKLEALAAPIVRAERVWIITGETARAGAHALHSGLTIVRPGVHLVREHTSGSDLGSASKGDTAVVFDFARYRRHAITAARTLARDGVEIVAITDGPLSPLATLTDSWCALTIPAVGPFDSSVPAVAVAELLVASVATRLRDKARDRIDRTEALWEATGTFLQ